MRWRSHADRDIDAITRRDRQAAERIRDAIHRLAEHSQGDVTKLAGAPGEYLLREGDWRVVFSFEDNGRTLLILRVLPRNEGTYRRR